MWVFAINGDTWAREMSKRKHSHRYHLAVRPRSRPLRVALWSAFGLGLGWVLGAGSVGPSIVWGIVSATFATAMMEAYAKTHAAVLGESGVTIVGPVAVRAPRTDVEIPYAALVDVEDLGRKIRLDYHVDPLLVGSPPTHHLTIEPDDKAALLHALQTRMERAQRHHFVDRARNRYRLALSYLATIVVVTVGAWLISLVRS
jgi:hypothetical protein